MRPPSAKPTLFPYTTLFRSELARAVINLEAKVTEPRRRGLEAHSAEKLAVLRDSIGDSLDRKSTRLNSSHITISYAVFCLKKKRRRPSTILSDNLPAAGRYI